MKNGSGSNERLNRIEALQEEFQRELNQLLKAQVIQQGLIEDWPKQMQESRIEFDRRMEKLDERIQSLVSAIGAFISPGKPSP